MSAIRLARAATGRKIIVKFEGCYHGHADGLLVKAGSGVATFGIPGSAGVPEEIAHLTLALPFNDLVAVEAAFAAHPEQIAAVIIEPVVGNAGCIPPAEGYLAGLRALTASEGALLIVDEVMTGFRVALGGAIELYGIDADLVTLGKIVGGGLPVGVFGGKRAVMDLLAPLGPVYQAGDAKRQSAGHGRGNRHYRLSAGACGGGLSQARRHIESRGGGRGRGSGESGRAAHDQSRRGHVDVVLHAGPGEGLCRAMRRRQTRRRLGAFTEGCWNVACGCRPASLRRRSWAPRMAMRKCVQP